MINVRFLLAFFSTLVFIYFLNELVFKAFTPAICVSSSIWVKTIIVFLIAAIFAIAQKYPISFGLILAGGFFGIVELSVTSCIKDYINFGSLFKFNISDSAITLGSITLFYSVLKDLMRRS